MSKKQVRTLPETVEFPVDEIVCMIAHRFPENINRIYWFLHGDPNWKKTKKSFPMSGDALESLRELLCKRINCEQMDIISSFDTIHKYKIYNRYRIMVSERTWKRNRENSFQWFLLEARKCFKTITVYSK
jgi:hypothetical protein